MGSWHPIAKVWSVNRTPSDGAAHGRADCEATGQAGQTAVTFISVLTTSRQGPAIVSRLSISQIHQRRFLHISPFNITSHLGHLGPSPVLRPCQMTIRDTATGLLPSWPGTTAPELYVLRRTRRYCLWEEPGESDHSRLLRRPGESTVASKHLPDLTRRRSEPDPFC